MKVKNNKTGEIIDLSTIEELKESAEDKTKKRIEKRGTIQESVKEKFESESNIQKAIGVAEIAGAPFSAIESAIANPALQIQKGKFRTKEDIGNLIKESVLGITLQKQAQYGDIMKNAGYNPILADTLGFVLHVSPIKVYSEVSKTFGSISKMSDKALAKAGDNLLNAINQAKKAAGTKVSQEFTKLADNIPVDGWEFVKQITKLPQVVMKKAETVFGPLENYADGLTIGKIRELKRFLGKLRPSSYGQTERGIQETLDTQDLNAAYSGLKNIMQKFIESSLGKKTANYLMQLEEAYSDVADASRFIRRSITDPILKLPTKTGNFAETIAAEGNASARVALNTIKKTSRQAMKRINKAMKTIEEYSRSQKLKGLAAHAVRAAAYGGIAGGIGGRILARVQKRD